MNHAYSVSHIHDETGSAKARHYEALKAAQTRHLAEVVKGEDNRLIRRVIGGLSRARIALGGKLGMKQRKGAQYNTGEWDRAVLSKTKAEQKLRGS